MEIHADGLFKATKVDGVYDKDPVTNADAKMIDSMTFDRFISERIRVMDATAATLCRDNGMQIRVFKLAAGNIRRAVFGEKIGTTVSGK
jgi:uridylate kinase